ncbi:Ubiquinone biosynthesis O-methyltransferase [Roseivivax jejudonensis]|uniref:Ubiquinone biosynthesis O-methyltransferase n=1 Tax=Roseivivax jejudonensis TaxID=1529041 RepID=A0A1X6Z4L5_9RHOB|nr:bifunctional 2-polyprenyl-6-hydroxyphenol methylase/3-demethylubiquinol 3-O-methyltransferase UbiG [Roseivivax jejudonensis]SLN40585.1 Ubiquinone biosynthesis O-methyltransferase [Roseivivax jejudonensis]
MAETARNDLSIYDDAASKWWSDEVRWVRTLKNLVPGRFAFFDKHVDWAGKRVLDLGCAGGFMAEPLARRGADVVGLDPAEEAIAAAREHAEDQGLSIRYEIGVGEDMRFADGDFDAVVCVDVLEHVADLSKVLRECARVLAPGGVFLFDTINRNAVASFLAVTMAERVIGLLPRGTHDPEMFIKPKDLKAELRAAGLEPDTFTGLGPRGMNRRGDMTFGPLPLQTVQYMGLARKAA